MTDLPPDSPRPDAPRPDAPRPDPRRWKALSVALTAGFMTLLDVSIVNVALPSIRTALDASPAALQWVVSGYALSFGLVLVAAGRLGDAKGRRGVFIAGVALFTLASLGAGLAPSAGWLVAARLVQGVGGGVINPQVSGLIQQLFQGAERGRAFGRLGTTIGISTAVGPVVGGTILSLVGSDHGWRWLFLVNLPVGVLAIVLARRYIAPVAHREPARDLDPVGAVLLGLGTVGVLWPLVSDAWRPWQAGLVAGGVGALAVFWWWEHRQERTGQVPMVRPSLLARPGFAPGALLAMVYFFGFTGVFFVLTMVFQNGLGWTPLQAGLGLTPFALGSAVSATVGGRWVSRAGRAVAVAGLVLVAVGLGLTDLVLASGAAHLGVWLLAPLLVAGLGSGLVISPNQTLTLAAVPVREAGAAGGVLQTGQRLGTAAGVAVVGALYFRGVAGGGAATHAGSVGLRSTLVAVLVALALAVADLVARRRAPAVPD